MNKTQLEFFIKLLEQTGVEFHRTDFESGETEVKVYNYYSEYLTFDFDSNGSIKEIS